MQTISSTSKTAQNARLYLAFQSKRDDIPAPVSPDAPAWWAVDAESADVGRNVTFERIRTMRDGREEGDPLRDAISAPQSLTTFLDKRHIGLHLGGLLGEAASEDANATGFVMFSEQPEAGSTLDINGVTWTFVAAAAAANETQIGATLAETVVSLATDLNDGAVADVISEATYVAAGHRLLVTAVAAGAAGDSFALGAGTAAKFVSAPTLRGGGLRRHTFVSGKKDLPMLALLNEQTDLQSGPRFKVVKNMRYGGMQLSIQRNGAARIVFNTVGVNEVELDGDPVAGHTVDAVVSRYSHLQGGILIDDECVCGVVEGGQISYSNGLSSDSTLCCPGDPDAGAISDSSPGAVEVGVTLNARYYDPAVTGKAESGDRVKIIYQFVDPADGSSLTFTFARVTLPETTRSMSPGGSAIVQSFAGIASKPAAGWSMVVDLVNDVQAY